MRLYSGSSTQFIEDTVRNQVAGKLVAAFREYFSYEPSKSLVASWQNSLRAVKDVFELARLNDHGVILEYEIPMTSLRLDCLVCGKNDALRENAVIMELKQWQDCEASECESQVRTWLAGTHQDVLHPSAQARQYAMYLEDNHTAFHEGRNPIALSACAYLHNHHVESGDALLAPKFSGLLSNYPLFSADDVPALGDYLRSRLMRGGGMDVLPRIEKGRYRPSKKLMDHVAALIKGLPTHGHPEYVLLDEQLVVFEKVVSLTREGFHSRRKVAVIVQGGPGTGKSVIAFTLMGELLAKGYNAHYATNSKACTETLKKILGERGRVQVRYLSSYDKAESNSVDVLIADEAHRLKARTQIPHQRTRELPQVDEILKASKVSVLFVDDRQNVKPDEVGTAAHIREHAESAGCTVHQFKLDVQFRCKGSEGFVNWVENTLGIARTPNVLWNSDDEFDFQVFDSPVKLQEAIETKVAEGNTGRLVAGFCWPWSQPRADGTLVDDVVIGEFRRPWNARPTAKHLAASIPIAPLWAYDPNGMHQVGCIYTVQGFEFEYVGVIFGNDLVYDFETQSWVGHPEHSCDKAVRSHQAQFAALVKNTYRILLSRAMKGCYVFFLDKNTERFVKSRMERTRAPISLVEPAVSRLVLLPPSDPRVRIDAYRTLLPVYSLRAAAGYFGRGESAELQGWTEVSGVGKLDEQMFVAQVVGHSMEPRISDGEYCLFKANPVGTRQGKVVLAQSREIHDPDTGGSFTVKKYSSEKVALGENEWRHTRIVLTPINPQYNAIILKPKDEVQIVAELLTVLGRE